MYLQQMKTTTSETQFSNVFIFKCLDLMTYLKIFTKHNILKFYIVIKLEIYYFL